MPSLMSLFDTAGLTPHGYCLSWRPDFIRLDAASDVITAVAYYSIPAVLVCLVIKRRDLAFSWMFLLFAGFTLACGTTHWLDAWTLWTPDYAIQSLVKAVTAGLSAITAVTLWPLMPRVLALPSPSALQSLKS